MTTIDRIIDTMKEGVAHMYDGLCYSYADGSYLSEDPATRDYACHTEEEVRGVIQKCYEADPMLEMADQEFLEDHEREQEILAKKIEKHKRRKGSAQ